MKALTVACACALALSAVEAGAQTTYALGNWTVSAKQDKGVKRLFNRMNRELAEKAIADGTIINAGGSGYSVGDMLTIIDSGTTVTAMTFRVTQASPIIGVVQAVEIVNHGNYTTHQGAANHQTTVAPSGGSGCVLRINFYGGVPDMVTRNGGILDGAAFSYAAQLESEIKDAIAASLGSASDTQINNAAAALGVTVPR